MSSNETPPFDAWRKKLRHLLRVNRCLVHPEQVIPLEERENASKDVRLSEAPFDASR